MSKPKSGQNLNTKGSDVISKTASTSKKATNFLKKFKKAKKGAKTAKKLGKLGKTIKAPAFCLKAGGAATGVVIVFICIAILTCMLNPLNIFFNSLLNIKSADQKIMELLGNETTMSNSVRKKIATEASKRWQCSEKTPSFLSEAYAFIDTFDYIGLFDDPEIEWREKIGFFDEDDSLNLQYKNTYPWKHEDAKTVTGANAQACIINVYFASGSSGQVDYSNKDVDSDTTVENITVDQIVLSYANAVESALAYYTLDTQKDPADDEKFDTTDQRIYDETSLFEEAKDENGENSGELQLNENGKKAIESSNVSDDNVVSDKIYEELRKIVTPEYNNDGKIKEFGTSILTVDNSDNFLYPKSDGHTGIWDDSSSYKLMDVDFAQSETVDIPDGERLFVYDLNAEMKVDLRKYKKTEIKETIEKMVDKGQCVFSTDESKIKLGTDKYGNDIEPTKTCTKSEAKIAFWSYVANMYNSGLYQRGASETTHVYRDKYGNVFGIDENSDGSDGNTAIADDGTYMINSKGEETCMYLRIMQGLPTTLTDVKENYADYSDGTVIWPIAEEDLTTDAYTSFADESTYSEGAIHAGFDFGCDYGTPLYAVFSGTFHKGDISQKGGTVEKGGISAIITSSDVTNDNGDAIAALYIHASEYVVEDGEEVEQGELIGYSGRSKNEIAHLCFKLTDYPNYFGDKELRLRSNPETINHFYDFTYFGGKNPMRLCNQNNGCVAFDIIENVGDDVIYR